MLAKIYSRAQAGVDAPAVIVEVHQSNGLPALNIVGLPEAAVRESKDRVRSALINSRFDFPARKLTVNLAPAREALRPDTPPDGEASAVVTARVATARERQLTRSGKPNARMSTREVNKHCRPDAAGQQLLERAMEQLGLSARAYHRILKVARTIADLAASDGVSAAHVAEAVGYRVLDRKTAG